MTWEASSTIPWRPLSRLNIVAAALIPLLGSSLQPTARLQAVVAPPAAFPQPQMVIVARAGSAGQVDSPVPTYREWTFQVERTLAGTDVEGDAIAVRGSVNDYREGATYILYLRPDGRAATVERFVEATEAAVKQATAEISKAGGTVEPKLRMWAVVGTWEKFISFTARLDGVMDFQVWDGGRRGEKLVLSYHAKLSKEVMDEFYHRFTEAPEAKMMPDQMFGYIGWRDHKGLAHQKPYYIDPEGGVWDSIYGAVMEGKGEWQAPGAADAPLLATMKEHIRREYERRRPATRPSAKGPAGGR